MATTKRKKRPTKLQLECSELTIRCTELQDEINFLTKQVAHLQSVSGRMVHLAVVRDEEKVHLGVYSTERRALDAVQPGMTAGRLATVKAVPIDG